MTNDEIALSLVQSWLSQSEKDKSVEEVAQAYLDFLYAAENQEVKFN